MFKKLSLTAAALAMTAGGIAATPAAAQYYDPYGGGRYAGGWDDGYYGRDGYYDRRGDRGWYRDRGVYRGQDFRYACRRDSGTTGTILGAVVGGLLGREVIGRRGDRTAGAIAGAGAGALAGRALDRSGNRCR
jgi:hypothetical protein